MGGVRDTCSQASSDIGFIVAGNSLSATNLRIFTRFALEASDT